MIRKSIEKRLRQQKRRRKFMRLSIFLLGKTKIKLEMSKFPEKRQSESKKCLKDNGQQKLTVITRPKDKSLS
jgi:hypothetical protein